MYKIIFLTLSLLLSNCIPKAKLNNPMHSAGLMTQLLNMVVNPQDTIPPSFAGVSSASPAGSNSILLSWTAAQDNLTTQNAIVYDIYMAPQKGWENYNVVSFSTTGGATNFTAAGLSVNTTYYFVVRARDNAGNRDGNTVEMSATTAPTPQILSVNSQNSDLTAGDMIYLQGTDFDPNPSGNIVKLGACTLTVTNSTSTSITAILPSDRTCTSGKISVTTQASNFTYIYPNDYKYFHNLLLVMNTEGSITSYLLDSSSSPTGNYITTPSLFPPVAFGTQASLAKITDTFDPQSASFILFGFQGGNYSYQALLKSDGSVSSPASQLVHPFSFGTLTVSPNNRFFSVGLTNGCVHNYGFVNHILVLRNSVCPSAAPVNSLTISTQGNFVYAISGSGTTYMIPVANEGLLNSSWIPFSARSVTVNSNDNIIYYTDNSIMYSSFITVGGGLNYSGFSINCPSSTQPLYVIRDSYGFLYVNGGSKVCIYLTMDSIGKMTLDSSTAMSQNILEKTMMMNTYNLGILALVNSSTSTILQFIPSVFGGGTAGQKILSSSKVPLASTVFRQYR